MSFFIKHKWIIRLALIGGIIGYGYYFFIGCTSGRCVITSKPINCSLYGVLMGAFLGDLIKNKKK